jgi:hypothetical protein
MHKLSEFDIACLNYGQRTRSFAGYSKPPLGGYPKPLETKPKKTRQRRRQEVPDPRFLTRSQAAAYLGLGEHVFAIEVQYGRWPAPVPGGVGRGARWDVKALDRRADELSGLSPRETLSPASLTDVESQAMAFVNGVTR